MNGRVAELAVRYHVPRGASIAAAQVPLLERAIRSGLANEVAEQIAAVADTDGEVVVLREATARITLRPSDWSLDHAMLERIGRAAREAVLTRLARPAGSDDLMRFASEAEFVGSFVVDLLGGSAWDRWYYGAFRRFRRAGDRETLESLLADAEIDRASVLAWLEARGKLAEVLRLVGASTARLALVTEPAQNQSPPADLRPLAIAALAIAEALGLAIDHTREPALLAEYYATHPARPAWDDRRALTSWVWSFVQWLLARESGGAGRGRIRHEELAALHELLNHRLDWLDGAWLERQADAEGPLPPASKVVPGRLGAGPAVTPRHAALLSRLAGLIRAGTLRLDLRREPRDQLVVRMVAALEAAGESTGSRDRAFLVLLDRVCGAWPGESEPAPPVPADPAVVELATQLRESAKETAEGIGSRGAGLYLLTRAVSDLRLTALAEGAAVPPAPLLGAVARKLLGLDPPFDDAVAAWVGDANPELGALEQAPLRLLQHRLLERLLGQGHIDRAVCAVHEFTWRGAPFAALSDLKGTCWPVAWPSGAASAAEQLRAWTGTADARPAADAPPRGPVADLAELARLDGVAPAVEVAVTAVASGLLCAWSRWLPGVSGSSMPFLVRTCLARGGAVRLEGDLADVTLTPAPLDPVLELAGYLKPVESIPWLGRRVRFSIARSRR